jgi:hypothetical protein
MGHFVCVLGQRFVVVFECGVGVEREVELVRSSGSRRGRGSASVARIERKRNPGFVPEAGPGFRFTQSGLRLLIPRNAYFLGNFDSRLMASRASKPIASAHSINSTTSTSFCPVST